MKEIEKTYDFKEWERFLYSKWLDAKVFRATVDEARGKRVFTIMMPPPNVTGNIHMGHVLDNTIQDVVARFKRMTGYYVLWQPGTDHAGIATQNVVERELKKEGKTRWEVGREEFIKRVWEWKEKYGNLIIESLKKLGISPDWDRLRFTLDDGYSKAVIEAFVRLYEAGLIYRGYRLINWCPRCGTALADDEVEREEESGYIYYLRYPLTEGGYIVVATTRPETYLGDVAVAVNPQDERYKGLIGKRVKLPFVGKRVDAEGKEVYPEIPIISDESVDMGFGTGAVKITPAHDFNDWEIGEKHKLPKVQVIDFDGKINENGGEWKGLDRFEARERIVKAFANAGLLEKVEKHTYSPGRCYRCSTVIEPLPSLQWFVKMKPLAQKALEAYDKGELIIVPEMFGKVYKNWLENVKDWCISRQIWWGHRIPAYYGPDGEVFVGRNYEEALQKAEKRYGEKVELKQDEDVLDTWFSSWLWPFATLGWPEETEDLKVFYPTHFLQSGWDILFFWDARMIMAGLFFTGKVPFKVLYLHGLLRDKYGRKFSKSLGNFPDVFELLDKYGADGLRFGVMSLTPEGRDIRFDENQLLVGRNFANKMWNINRLINMYLEGEVDLVKPNPTKPYQKWALHMLGNYIDVITKNLENYEFDDYVKNLYHLIWSNVADWLVEASKPYIKEGKREALDVLLYVWINSLKLAHPIMPFITDAIYETLPLKNKEITLMKTEWPRREYEYPDEYEYFEDLKEAITVFRSIKDLVGIKSAPYRGDVDESFVFLAGAENGDAEIWVKIPSRFEVYIGLTREQKNKVVQKLNREREELLSVVSKVEKKLSSDFVHKAPKHVIENEREKYKTLKAKLSDIERQLEMLNG
ncbi:MAG: valine--tRNA ligase [candidate division WOR-3 bacterium]